MLLHLFAFSTHQSSLGLFIPIWSLIRIVHSPFNVGQLCPYFTMVLLVILSSFSILRIYGYRRSMTRTDNNWTNSPKFVMEDWGLLIAWSKQVSSIQDNMLNQLCGPKSCITFFVMQFQVLEVSASLFLYHVSLFHRLPN